MALNTILGMVFKVNVGDKNHRKESAFLVAIVKIKASSVMFSL